MADPTSCLRDLPIEVLNSITDRTDSFGDCVRFDSVIRGFAVGGSSRRQLQKLGNFPWLVVDVDETTKMLCFFSRWFFFPVHAPIPTTRVTSYCFGSFFNWLFMADTGCPEGGYLNNYLLNPCSDQRIQLPPFNIKRRIGKVIMSEADGGLLVMTNHSVTLAFCRLGDSQWSLLQKFSPTGIHCEDIIFFKGILYVVDPECRVTAFDFLKIDFVESDGKLLLVVKEIEVCCRNEVDHGDDCTCYDKAVHFVLLLDSTCNMSLDALKFTQFGFRPNCIDYTNRGEADDYGWHEFCL